MCAAEWMRDQKSLLDQVRAQKLCEPASTLQSESKDHQVMLVSSPGYAILDSGCGKTIVGMNTLSAFHSGDEHLVSLPQNME